MLSLPYVLREASLLWGVAIIVAVCSAATLSFYMLAVCCQLCGHADYRRIGTAAFGPAMGRAIQGTVLCYTAAACVSFVVLLGDLVPAVVLKLTHGVGPVAHLLGARTTAIPILGAAVLLPMSCVRDLRHFQHSSAFALACDFLAAYIIVSHFFAAPAPGPLPLAAHVAPTVNWATPGLSALTTMPIVVVAANAHYNAPRYRRTPSNPNTSSPAPNTHTHTHT
jgi:amino acid permease